MTREPLVDFFVGMVLGVAIGAMLGAFLVKV